MWQYMNVVTTFRVAVTVLFAVCFYYGKNNCPVKSINVSKIISKDNFKRVCPLSICISQMNLFLPDENKITVRYQLFSINDV